MSTITEVTTYTVMTCPVDGCGIKYALDEAFRSRRRSKGGSWYCPNGHSLSYHHAIKSEVEELEKQLAAARGNQRHTAERLESEKRRHAATKGQLTKTRKRARGGVCPCCNRSFVQLARHMKSQHPDFDPDAV